MSQISSSPNPTEAMSLSVVVPVYNEAGSIVALVHEIATTLRPCVSFEIVVVNDASTDETDQALVRVLGQLPELRVLVHSRNAGQSMAVRSGVIASRAAWVVTLDGDGQNDPADIPSLLRVKDQLPAFVRLISGVRTKRRDGVAKRIASRVANVVRGYLLRDYTPDSGCGLKMFERSTFLELPYFDHMHRFLPALVRRMGGEVMNVPVNHRPRMAGASKYGTLDRLIVGIADLRGVLWLVRRYRRTTVSETVRWGGVAASPSRRPRVGRVSLGPIHSGSHPDQSTWLGNLLKP